MPVFKTVLGLDLGAHSIRAVELHQTFRGFEPVRVCSQLRDDEHQPLPEAVRQFVEVNQLGTEHVITALPSHRVSSRRMSFPFREKRKLGQAVPFEVEDTLPFDLEDMLLDWEVVGGDRSGSDVAAIVAPRSEVSKLIEALHEADCDPRTVEAEGLILANLCSVFDLPGTRMLADLGHAKTTLCVVRDGRPIAARSVPVAGRALTEAVAQDRSLGLAEAERAKCEDGIFSPGNDRPLPRAELALERIAAEMLRTAASLEPALSTEGIGEITLFGGTAQLERLDDWLAKRTGIPCVRLGLPREEHAGLVAGGPPLLFAPTIALALRGTAHSVTEMNFRQDEFARRLDLSRYRQQFGSTGILAGVVLLLALLSAGTGTYLESMRARGIEAQVEALYGEVFPGRTVPSNPIASMRQAVSEANERADFLGVYRGNLSALDLLVEISKRVPPELEVVFEELSIDRQTVRIRVYSKSFEAADRLGAELGKFAPFAQTRIGAIETDKRRGGKKFNVTISLAPPEGRA